MVMAEKPNKANGPVLVLIPLRRFSMHCHKGEELYDPERDTAFISAFKKYLQPRVRVMEVDVHINDPIIAQTAVAELRSLIEG